VAYWPAEQKGKRKRGRPKMYGDKVKLKDLFSCPDRFIEVDSPFPGEEGIKIKYFAIDLLWRPVARLINLFSVIHPKGKWILIGTDLTLDPLRMIQLYGLRFRIELCFKQLVFVVGAFTYRFWSKYMDKRKRGDGDQYLHHEPKPLPRQDTCKIRSYHLYLQLAMIALGLMQWLSFSYPKLAWRNFNSWMRTMKQNLPPSELVRCKQRCETQWVISR